MTRAPSLPLSRLCRNPGGSGYAAGVAPLAVVTDTVAASLGARQAFAKRRGAVGVAEGVVGVRRCQSRPEKMVHQVSGRSTLRVSSTCGRSTHPAFRDLSVARQGRFHHRQAGSIAGREPCDRDNTNNSDRRATARPRQSGDLCLRRPALSSAISQLEAGTRAPDALEGWLEDSCVRSRLPYPGAAARSRAEGYRQRANTPLLGSAAAREACRLKRLSRTAWFDSWRRARARPSRWCSIRRLFANSILSLCLLLLFLFPRFMRSSVTALYRGDLSIRGAASILPALRGIAAR
ncbi:hypothetical protein Q5P01_000529 [Channa striata]|uniref:Uncharacterized protein n=1 Tax=Channa striata TaxID=64152 RepID=A0AA88IDI4_CHASR|nr:hypothetical protein Q5P01_000529 [Channa striata]